MNAKQTQTKKPVEAEPNTSDLLARLKASEASNAELKEQNAKLLEKVNEDRGAVSPRSPEALEVQGRPKYPFKVWCTNTRINKETKLPEPIGLPEKTVNAIDEGDAVRIYCASTVDPTDTYGSRCLESSRFNFKAKCLDEKRNERIRIGKQRAQALNDRAFGQMTPEQAPVPPWPEAETVGAE